MRPLMILGLGLLTGCPFLFGPPELGGADSGAGGAGTGAGTGGVPTTGTGTGTGTGGTTGAGTGAGPGTGGSTGTGTGAGTGGSTGAGTGGGTGTGTGNPLYTPVITSVDVSLGYGVATLVVDIDDPNLDMLYGALLIDDGVVPVSYTIPGDLQSWNALTEVATVQVPLPVDCAGVNTTFAVGALDLVANLSNTVLVDLVAPPVAHLEPSDPTDAGVLDPPFIACGDLGNGNDDDYVHFTTTAAGTYTFSLTDASGNNRDMELRDSGGAVLATASTAADPDSLSYALMATTTYEIHVYSPNTGSGSNWTVVVHE